MSSASDQGEAIREAVSKASISEALESISEWHLDQYGNSAPASLFEEVVGQWTIKGIDDPVASSKISALAESFYWACFFSGIGGQCHAFIEFNGVMSKYAQLARRAESLGVPLHELNQHNTIQVQIEHDDVAYLGEKLRCIFAPFLRGNPKARAALLEELSK